MSLSRSNYLRIMSSAALLAALAARCNGQVVSYTENVAFPSDAGAINVKNAPYNAYGDGVHDDTAAILAAINASGPDLGAYAWQDQIVYLPSGTYLVSAPLVKTYSQSPLHYGCGLVLMGESQTGTVIQLANSATGYQSTSSPQGVIVTTSQNSTYGGGESAYHNAIENLTVNVGANNPGAIGISYLANNEGAIRNVTVTAPASSGTNGIDMTVGYVGPTLLENVTVNGFQYGIVTGNTEYGVTLEHISLLGQLAGGIVNYQNMLAANYIYVDGDGKSLNNTYTAAGSTTTTPNGLVVLNNSNFVHGGADPILIANAGSIVFNNTTVSNSESFTGTTTSPVQGVLSGSANPAQFTANTLPWNITAVDTPIEAYDAVTNWYAAGDSSASFTNSNGSITPATAVDATASIQAALNSGKSTVYLPHGVYYISANLTVPATVNRIEGMDSTLRVLPTTTGWNTSTGMLNVSATSSTALIVERLGFDSYGAENNGASFQPISVYSNVARDVVMRDIFTNGVHMAKRDSSGGRLFLEDVCCSDLVAIAGSSLVAARQLDIEGKGYYGGPWINNDGSPVWILGMKTEAPAMAVQEVASGGAVQILGALYYTDPVTTPATPTVPGESCATAAATIVSSSSATPSLFRQDGNTWIQASFVEEVLVPSGTSPAYYSFPWYLTDKANSSNCVSNSIGIARTGVQPGGDTEAGFVVPTLVNGPSTPPTVP